MKNGSFLLLLNESRTKIFLVKRSDFPIWGLTGGGVEEGESTEDAAVREATEETGLKVKLLGKLGEYIEDGFKRTIYEGRVLGGAFVPEYIGCKGEWYRINKLPFNMLNLSKRIIRDSVTVNSIQPFELAIRNIYDKKDLWLLFVHPVSAMKYVCKMFVSKRVN